MKKVEMFIIIAEAMLDKGLEATTSEFIEMYEEHGFSIDDRFKDCDNTILNVLPFEEVLPPLDKICFVAMKEVIINEATK